MGPKSGSSLLTLYILSNETVRLESGGSFLVWMKQQGMFQEGCNE